MARFIVTRRGSAIFDVKPEGHGKSKAYIYREEVHMFYGLRDTKDGFMTTRESMTGSLESVLTTALKLTEGETGKYVVKLEGRMVHVMRELI
jgi:hypothetical protein